MIALSSSLAGCATSGSAPTQRGALRSQPTSVLPGPRVETLQHVPKTALSVAQALRAPAGLAQVVGYLWREPIDCPPCPPRADCEPCPKPQYLFGDRPPARGPAPPRPPWLFVTARWPVAPPLVVGHRYVLDGKLQRDYRINTLRATRIRGLVEHGRRP